MAQPPPPQVQVHQPISVLIVDDQPMIRAGIRGILSSDPDLTVVAEAADGATGVQMAASMRPDVILMDLRMPGMDGTTAIRTIRDRGDLGNQRIIVLTTFDDDPEVVEALQAGADGFLSKGAEPSELLAAVQAVAAGQMALSPSATRVVVERAFRGSRNKVPDSETLRRISTLTSRELDIVRGAALGLDNTEIGQRLYISPFTVKTHLTRAMGKLGVRARAQLVALAYQNGVVDD